MTTAGARKWLKGQVPKGQKLPVMFFGTREVCWMPPAALSGWQTGVESGFADLSRRKDKRLVLAVKQVRFYPASSSRRTGLGNLIGNLPARLACACNVKHMQQADA